MPWRDFFTCTRYNLLIDFFSARYYITGGDIRRGRTWGAGSGAFCLCSCCPVAFRYAARCAFASLLYLRLCACSCLLVLLVALLLLLLLLLVTRLHDHARCLCCRGDHAAEHATNDLHLRVVLVCALHVLRGVLGGVVRWHLAAGGKPAAGLLDTHEYQSARMRPRRCPRRKSGCPCTWRRAWPRAPPPGSMSHPRGVPRCRRLSRHGVDFGKSGLRRNT